MGVASGKHRLARVAAGMLVAIPILVAAGCGSVGELPLGRVTGRVTYQGKPLAGWIIYFVPQRGPSASGVIDEEGHYTLTTRSSGDGAVVGTHTVYFAPPSPAGPAEAESAVEGPEVPPPPIQTIPLPQKYRSPDGSGLTAEVESGGSTRDFEL